MPATKKKSARKPAVRPFPHAEPLLVPVDRIELIGRTVRGWRFTRTPNHWMYSDIEPGTILVNEPPRHPASRREYRWHIFGPRWGDRPVPDHAAAEYLMIAAIEAAHLQSLAIGEKPAIAAQSAVFNANVFAQYAAAAAAGEV